MVFLFFFFIQSGGDDHDDMTEYGDDLTTARTSCTVTPPSSPSSEPKSRQNIEDKVYTVATGKTIKSLMTEYKKRKQAHTMPTFVKATRSKPAPIRKERPVSTDPVDQQVDQQHKASIMKVRSAPVTWLS